MKDKIKKIRGFTIAEVLITLGIIGIVAQMTIPALVKDIKDTQYRVMFKKSYSNLEGITRQIMADNGGTLIGLTNNFQVFRDYFGKYFIKVRTCNFMASKGICWHNDGEVRNMQGTVDNYLGDLQGFLIADSAFVQTYFGNIDCLEHVGNIDRCGFIRVDVNGFQKPNIVGRDIFYLHILKDRLLPYGTADSGYNTATTTCNKNNTGYGCAAYVLSDKDY